jgi:hypothetical protein
MADSGQPNRMPVSRHSDVMMMLILMMLMADSYSRLAIGRKGAGCWAFWSHCDRMANEESNWRYGRTMLLLMAIT